MRKLTTSELNRLTIDEFKLSKRLSVVVVLDHVRSGHNVGSVFRTCDAFGIEKLYLCGITPQPPNREVLKTALGSSDSVEWRHFRETKSALEELRSEGYEIVFAEHTSESISLQQFFPSAEKKFVFVFGNEVEGINSELLHLADHIIEIPQFGTKHSFNIAVAAGIVLWDFYLKFSPGI